MNQSTCSTSNARAAKAAIHHGDDEECTTTTKTGLKTLALNKSSSNRRRMQKKCVTFCPTVTVNMFISTPQAQDTSSSSEHTVQNAKTGLDLLSDVAFEEQRQQEMTRCSNVHEKSTVPLINTDGRVCRERHIHRHVVQCALLSYQKRLVGSGSSFKYITDLLAPISLKLSQRARDIALETARVNMIEVGQSPSASVVPICISQFPEIKKRAPSCSASNPQVKRKRKRCPEEASLGFKEIPNHRSVLRHIQSL